MNIDKLRQRVRDWYNDGYCAQNKTLDLYERIEHILGVRPLTLQWGACCLYITLPGGVDVNVKYSD